MGWILGREEHGRLARAGKKKLVLLAGLRATRAPVYRAKAGRWVAALCVVASALVPVPAAAPAPTTKFVSNRGSNCATRASSLSSSTLSGAPARVLTWSCTDGYKAIGITALHAHRGYFMIVASRTTSSRASDRTAFNAARDSFRFLSK